MLFKSFLTTLFRFRLFAFQLCESERKQEECERGEEEEGRERTHSRRHFYHGNILSGSVDQISIHAQIFYALHVSHGVTSQEADILHCSPRWMVGLRGVRERMSLRGCHLIDCRRTSAR